MTVECKFSHHRISELIQLLMKDPITPLYCSNGNTQEESSRCLICIPLDVHAAAYLVWMLSFHTDLQTILPV